MLTKTTTVLRRGWTGPVSVDFLREREDPSDRMVQVSIDRQAWAEMDYPDEVTVTVEVGDTLNAEVAD